MCGFVFCLWHISCVSKVFFLEFISYTCLCFISHLVQFCVSLRRIVWFVCRILLNAFLPTCNTYLGVFVPAGDAIMLVCNMTFYIPMVVSCVFMRLHNSFSGAYVYFWNPSDICIYSVWLYIGCRSSSSAILYLPDIYC